MLHLVGALSALNDAAARVAAEQVLVLMSESVLAAASGHIGNATLQTLLADRVSVCVLDEAAQAYGLSEAGSLLAEVQVVDYDDLLKLTEQHTPVLTWS
jgi:sulfur relay protein TusB/DsrH